MIPLFILRIRAVGAHRPFYGGLLGPCNLSYKTKPKLIRKFFKKSYFRMGFDILQPLPEINYKRDNILNNKNK